MDIFLLTNANISGISAFPFPGATEHECKYRIKIDIRESEEKPGDLTLHNRRTRYILRVDQNPDIVILTQQIVVAVSALRSKLAIREIEKCAGGRSAWSPNQD